MRNPEISEREWGPRVGADKLAGALGESVSTVYPPRASLSEAKFRLTWTWTIKPESDGQRTLKV